MNRIKSIRISSKNIKDDEDISIESSDDDDIIEETDDDMCTIKTNDDNTLINKKKKLSLDDSDNKETPSKENLRKKFLRQISQKIAPLRSPKNNFVSARKSYFDLLNSKQIFQKFLCIGIDESGLETIEDMDELMLMPKITFNYPNNKSESELEL